MSLPEVNVAPIQSDFLDTASRHAVKEATSFIAYLEIKESPANTAEGFGEPSLALPEIAISPKKKYVEVETYSYKVETSRELHDHLKRMHGTNGSELRSAAAYEEMVSSTVNKLYNIYKEAGIDSQYEWLTKWQKWCGEKFGVTYPKYVDPEKRLRSLLAAIFSMSNKVAVKCRRGPANFLIGNSQLISEIMDMPGFEPFIKREVTPSNGNIKLVGSLNGIKVFINPLATWKDNQIVMGRSTADHDPGVYFIELDKTFTEFQTEDNIDVTVLHTRQSILTVGETYKTSYITRKIEFRKPPFWKKWFKLIVG